MITDVAADVEEVKGLAVSEVIVQLSAVAVLLG
jgi:hypothetical protein